MRYNYRVRRWTDDDTIVEDQCFSLPINIDWLYEFYRAQNDYFCLIIEEFDEDGKEIGFRSCTKKKPLINSESTTAGCILQSTDRGENK